MPKRDRNVTDSDDEGNISDESTNSQEVTPLVFTAGSHGGNVAAADKWIAANKQRRGRAKPLLGKMRAALETAEAAKAILPAAPPAETATADAKAAYTKQAKDATEAWKAYADACMIFEQAAPIIDVPEEKPATKVTTKSERELTFKNGIHIKESPHALRMKALRRIKVVSGSLQGIDANFLAFMEKPRTPDNFKSTFGENKEAVKYLKDLATDHVEVYHVFLLASSHLKMAKIPKTEEAQAILVVRQAFGVFLCLSTKHFSAIEAVMKEAVGCGKEGDEQYEEMFEAPPESFIKPRVQAPQAQAYQPPSYVQEQAPAQSYVQTYTQSQSQGQFQPAAGRGRTYDGYAQQQGGHGYNGNRGSGNRGGRPVNPYSRVAKSGASVPYQAPHGSQGQQRFDSVKVLEALKSDPAYSPHNSYSIRFPERPLDSRQLSNKPGTQCGCCYHYGHDSVPDAAKKHHCLKFLRQTYQNVNPQFAIDLAPSWVTTAQPPIPLDHFPPA